MLNSHLHLHKEATGWRTHASTQGTQSSLSAQIDDRVEDTYQYLGSTNGGCCRLVAQKVHETGLPQVAAEHAATARDTVAGTAATACDRAAEHAAAAREVAAAKYSDLSAEVSSNFLLA